MLTNIQIQDIANEKILVSDLTNDDLLEFCKIANQRYRNGSPIISDENYDFIFISELTKRICLFFVANYKVSIKGPCSIFLLA